MKKKYKVLIVDDHPIICDAYKSAFEYVSNLNKNVKFDISIGHNGDDGVALVEAAANSQRKAFDIAFLDVSIPASENGEILSGEDLGLKIRKEIPDCRIVMATTFNDNYRIQIILKNVNPVGFLIKNDINKDELVAAIQAILENDSPYYSKSVLELFRKQSATDYKLDKIDRQMLYELSMGTKMKDLPAIIPLSMAGLEKRKKNLKDIFEVSGNSDRELILKAKAKGFI